MNKVLQELRKKDIDQLNAELVATRQEQFNLRIKHKTGQLNETNQLTLARKKIAKIKTLMNELKSQDSKSVSYTHLTLPTN